MNTRTTELPMADTKSREEIDDLKKEWDSNPSWELENTPGFEEYHNELLRYRMRKESEWEEAKARRRHMAAQSMGISLDDYDTWKELKSLSEMQRREARTLFLTLIYETENVDAEQSAIVEHLLDRIFRGAVNVAKAELIASRKISFE